MNQNTLHDIIARLHEIWGPPGPELRAESRALMEQLAQMPVSAGWFAELQNRFPEGLELARDPNHGFVLMAHTEHEGLYRPPHDHGAGWVIYSVQRGIMDMGTYTRHETGDGIFEVTRKGLEKLMPGQSRAYLPGDIHDTRCVSGPAVMFRLTSCDLKAEMKTGRMRRYRANPE